MAAREDTEANNGGCRQWPLWTAEMGGTPTVPATLSDLRQAKLLHPRRLSKQQPHPLVLRPKRLESSVILLSHLLSNHQQILLALLIALVATICSNPYHLPASKLHVFLKQPLE